jgi:hypothetical protein
MRTFTQQRKTTQQIAPEKSLLPPRRGPEVKSVLHLQRTVGSQAVPRQPQARPAGPEAVSTAAAPGRAGHDFSRIPVFSPEATIRPAAGVAPRAAFQGERSVEMPGEEEQTVDGGTSATGAATGCDCVPSSVQIKNVSPYRRGRLYGHDFDVEIALTYFQAASGPGTDAQLFWFERTDRPPAWQGLAANVWNDMFALFPTSATFNGWTRNRNKPCPGSEVATIHDPPGASVDLPARTLEFDIYVRGQQISHNARAKQVLEPDGSGGVKTQTFEILPSSYGPLAGP